MSGLKQEYNDDEVLERVAEKEAEQRPYNYEVAGVEAEDIVGAFDLDDFDSHPMVMVPNRMHHLSEAGYLEKVYPNRSSANAAYRITRRGWTIADLDEPETPVEDLED